MSQQTPPAGPPPRPGRRSGARPVLVIAAVVLLALLGAGTAAVLAARDDGEAFEPGVRLAANATPEAGATDAPPTATSAATESPPPTPTAASEATLDPTSSPTASPTPEPTPTATPTPEPTPVPMVVDLRPDSPGTGETMLVWVHAPRAESVAMAYRGESYPLTREGEVFFAIAAVPLNATPGEESLIVVARDAAGEVIEEQALTYSVQRVERPVDYLELTEEEGSVLTPEASAREYQLRLEQFAQFDSGRRWSGFFIRPAEGYITTEFGQGRSINGGPVGGFHSGTDIANELGTPVVAAAAGRVAWVGEMPIRGNTVILDHGSGVKTGYSHLDEFTVEVDQVIEAGDTIGLMGSTGLSTGPHVHWELTIYGVNVDPLTWLVKDFTP